MSTTSSDSNPTTNPLGEWNALIGTTGAFNEQLSTQGNAIRWVAEQIGLDARVLFLQYTGFSMGTDEKYSVLDGIGGDAVAEIWPNEHAR